MQEQARIIAARIEAQPWPMCRALVPALTLPVLFLHVRYQPKAEFGLGSSTVTFALSDAAVLAVVLTAVGAGVREGWEPLRPARRLWLLLTLFLALVIAATLHPLLWQDDYHFLRHLTTAAKFCEYALLAPALPLLLRRRDDALPLLWAAASWSVLATTWALLQFAGLVDAFEGRRPLQREASFLGIHDLAALSSAALVLGFAILVLGGSPAARRTLGWVATVAGAAGLVLSAAVAGVVGVGLAAAAALGVARVRRQLTASRALAVAGAVAVAAAGTLLMRAGELTRTLRSLGIGSQPQAARSTESYVHRSLLGYIGLRIFVDHPVLGVGWQGSQEVENYGRYVADAHRHFPNVPEVAFPSPEHSWGVQNAYLQTLADLGLVGLAALFALFVPALWLGLRASLRAPPEAAAIMLAGPLWLLAAAGVWNGLGLVAGIPLDALTWLALGLVAAGLCWAGPARAR